TTSDEVTANFVRRTLCAHQIRSGGAVDNGKGRITLTPLDELLPPLTSSNDVDLQLYALIAIIIKEFVQTWYSKITPDQQFTDNVIQIIAHCTRALEQRIRHVDLEALIFDEVPAIIDAHIAAYRTATGGLYSSALGTDPRTLYHIMHPHPALSPVPLESEPSMVLGQATNEAVWRQLLLQAALSQILPPEDVENPCLKVLVTDVLSELIVGNAICGRVSEAWFIWETTLKLIELARPSIDVKGRPTKPSSMPSRLEQFGLLSDEKAGDVSLSIEPKAGPVDIVFAIFWHIIWYLNMLFLGIRASFVSFTMSDGLQARSRFSVTSSSHAKHVAVDGIHDSESLSERSPQPIDDRPILGMSAWACFSRLLSLDLRMPWLTAICGFVQWLLIDGPGRVGCTNSRLDRLLSHQISKTIMNPNRLPFLLLSIRTNLFPNNTLGPGRVPPTDDEALEIKRQCASAMIRALPEFIRLKLFASQEPAAIQIEAEEMLDAFGDPYINKHVLFALVDLVFSRLFPEIQEQNISALL
ncbi:PXA domain-containing protein, partial [Delphinella strobiligena]